MPLGLTILIQSPKISFSFEIRLKCIDKSGINDNEEQSLNILSNFKKLISNLSIFDEKIKEEYPLNKFYAHIISALFNFEINDISINE